MKKCFVASYKETLCYLKNIKISLMTNDEIGKTYVKVHHMLVSACYFYVFIFGVPYMNMAKADAILLTNYYFQVDAVEEVFEAAEKVFNMNVMKEVLGAIKVVLVNMEDKNCRMLSTYLYNIKVFLSIIYIHLFA
jgi:hypothetical protein